MVDRGIRGAGRRRAYFLAQAWGLDIDFMTQSDAIGQRSCAASLNAAIIVLAADFSWTITKAVIARKLGETAGEGDVRPCATTIHNRRGGGPCCRSSRTSCSRHHHHDAC